MDHESAALKALLAALESEDEQDSDLFFVLFGAGRTGSGVFELGSAHVNMEQMLRTGREPTAELLPVVSERGERVASITVSVQALEALRWAQRSINDKTSVRISVDTLSLNQDWQQLHEETLRKNKLALLVKFPHGMPQVHSRPTLDVESGRVSLKLDEAVELTPGSAAWEALVTALGADDEQRANVFFILADSVDEDEGRQRHLGQSSINLQEVLRGNADLESKVLTLRDDSRADGVQLVGTVVLSFKALKALRRAEKTMKARRLHAQRHLISSVPRIPIGGGLPHEVGTIATTATTTAARALSQSGHSSTSVPYLAAAFPARESPPARRVISAALLNPLPLQENPIKPHSAPAAAQPRKLIEHRFAARGNASVVGDIESD